MVYTNVLTIYKDLNSEGWLTWLAMNDKDVALSAYGWSYMIYLMCFRTIEPIPGINTEIPSGVYLDLDMDNKYRTFIKYAYNYWRGTRIIEWRYIEPCNLPVQAFVVAWFSAWHLRSESVEWFDKRDATF